MNLGAPKLVYWNVWENGKAGKYENRRMTADWSTLGEH